MPNEESLATELSWTELMFRRSEYRSPSPTVRVLLCFIRCHGNICSASRWQEMDYSGLSRKRVLASRWLAVDYSGFQASLHNIFLCGFSLSSCSQHSPLALIPFSLKSHVSFKVCTQLWTEFSIFHISIRISESLLYKWPFFFSHAACSSARNMGTAGSSGTFVNICQITRSHIQEGSNMAWESQMSQVSLSLREQFGKHLVRGDRQ
jgi:hypothetical protein